MMIVSRVQLELEGQLASRTPLASPAANRKSSTAFHLYNAPTLASSEAAYKSTGTLAPRRDTTLKFARMAAIEHPINLLTYSDFEHQ